MHNKSTLERAPEEAKEVVFFGAADAVIVANPSVEETITALKNLRESVDVPILLGGYTDLQNAPRLLENADGAIVGGAFERESRQAGVDVSLVREFMAAVG